MRILTVKETSQYVLIAQCGPWLFFSEPVGFGLPSAFTGSPLLGPRCALTPAPAPGSSGASTSPRAAARNPPCSGRPRGRFVWIAMKIEAASRMRSFNTLIKGFRFTQAILNDGLFFKLHGLAPQVPLVILAGPRAFLYISVSHFCFCNEIIKHLMAC